MHAVVFAVEENDAVDLAEVFFHVVKRCQRFVIFQDEAAQGEALADVMQDGGDKNGIGPEMALVFLLFFGGEQWQFVLATQG